MSAKTSTERRILERRHAKGVLVPILEQTLEDEVRIEDAEDEKFMLYLMRARARQREQGMYSPSMLASCERAAYFAKTGQEKRKLPSTRANGFFLDGDFRHYKWQFALWKAHRKRLLILLGCEVRVFHPNGDFAGTIDAIVEIDGVVYVVDFKGMNSYSFQSHQKWGTQFGYRVQIIGYADIVNKAGFEDAHFGPRANVSVDYCLLVGENKGGPIQRGSPIALHEDKLVVSKERKHVKARMRRLRRFADNEEIPPPACTTTRTLGFQECPFSWFCKEEVQAIQRDKERTRDRNSAEPEIARSTRTRDDRAGGSTRRRKTRTS